ncbi:unnamed protein product, partial [Didymodactylos carnosus]
MTTNEQFSNIEYLFIDHTCNLDDLISILSYTPRLCRLICTEVNNSNKYITTKTISTISTSTYISITRCAVSFDDLEIFITQISSQLEVLRITCYEDATYLDANRWERIISQNLSHLFRFDFKYEEIIDEDFVVTKYHSLINQFNLSFWIERNWLCKLYIDTDGWNINIIRYSIDPYRLNKKSILAPIGAIIYGYLIDSHRCLSVSDMFYRNSTMPKDEQRSMKIDNDGGVSIIRFYESAISPFMTYLFFDKIPLWADLLPGRYNLTCQMRLRRN